MIKNLLEDFGTEKLASDVAALDGVGELFSELSTAYDRFNKANYEKSERDQGRKRDFDQEELDFSYERQARVISYLSAVASLTGYKDFVTKCEAEIAKANATVNGSNNTANSF